MNLIFKKIKELFSSNNTEVYRKKYIITAYRDWKILVSIFLVINIFIAAGSFYLFIKINKEEVFLLEYTGLILVDRIDKDRLNEVVEIFEDKKERFELLLKQKPKIADPSL